jgi:Domain of unknown function (DUF397)
MHRSCARRRRHDAYVRSPQPTERPGISAQIPLPQAANAEVSASQSHPRLKLGPSQDNLPGIVAVRDSKDRNGPILVLTSAQWREFTAGIRAGEHSAG